MRTISIRLDDHTDGVLTSYCERQGPTQTDAVRAAIEQLGQAHRSTPAELAERLGLVGAFRRDEGDLGAAHSKRLKARLRDKLARESMPVAKRAAPLTRASRPARVKRAP